MITLRWLFLGLVLTTTASVVSRLWDVLRVDGLNGAEIAFLVLVTILFAWITAAFWMTCIGAYALWRGQRETTLKKPDGGDPALRGSAARTALLFPIRNEEPGRLFAGIEAVIESVARRGALDKFDVFLLSDSFGSANLEAEQEAYKTLRERWRGQLGLYYRHRLSNAGKKAGNIAEFCRNWGARYDYMVVLDADSLMTGETLTRLVQTMDINPRAGLIQVAPQLVGCDSLFARLQQFASSIYGPVFTAGYAILQGGDGNYWGHNAIIRVRAFMENCGLPTLSGRAPFGGEIMSHDFVEAALLRRAGWEVHLATDLDGSYEEPPPSLIEYLKRDRRWCQGNLQHLKVMTARGIATPNRGHMAAGVMSYVASPLWLMLILASVAVMLSQHPVPPVAYWGRYPVLAFPHSHTVELVALLSATAAMLFAPKFLGLALLLRDPAARRAHGGGFAAIVSVLIECVISTVIAPVMMLSHTGFVLSIAMGRVSGWGSQQRGAARTQWGLIARSFLPHTLIGIAATAALAVWLPHMLWWFAPLLIGPMLAIPLAGLLSSDAAGERSRAAGLFLAPWETGGVPIVSRVRAACGAPVQVPQKVFVTTSSGVGGAI